MGNIINKIKINKIYINDNFISNSKKNVYYPNQDLIDRYFDNILISEFNNLSFLDLFYNYIEEIIIIGALHKLKKITTEYFDSEFYYNFNQDNKNTHYKLFQDYENLIKKLIMTFDRDKLYKLIDEYCKYKGETHNSSTINSIIDLIVGINSVLIFEYYFYEIFSIHPIINSIYKNLKNENQIMINEIKNSYKSKNNHECMNYEFIPLKKNKKYCCIICGKIFF